MCSHPAQRSPLLVLSIKDLTFLQSFKTETSVETSEKLLNFHV
jgi:hypothetical protein